MGLIWHRVLDLRIAPWSESPAQTKYSRPAHAQEEDRLRYLTDMKIQGRSLPTPDRAKGDRRGETRSSDPTPEGMGGGQRALNFFWGGGSRRRQAAFGVRELPRDIR